MFHCDFCLATSYIAKGDKEYNAIGAPVLGAKIRNIKIIIASAHRSDTGDSNLTVMSAHRSDTGEGNLIITSAHRSDTGENNLIVMSAHRSDMVHNTFLGYSLNTLQ
jgi:hypothetical protein